VNLVFVFVLMFSLIDFKTKGQVTRCRVSCIDRFKVQGKVYRAAPIVVLRSEILGNA